MSVQDRLRHVQSLDDQKEKTEQYKKLLGELIAAASEADINAYVEHSECCTQAPLPPAWLVVQVMLQCSHSLSARSSRTTPLLLSSSIPAQ